MTGQQLCCKQETDDDALNGNTEDYDEIIAMSFHKYPDTCIVVFETDTNRM